MDSNLPPSCLDKHHILDAGQLDETMVRNQDIDLHKRIISNGFKLLTSPKLKAIYKTRSTLKHFSIQAFQNGFWVIYGNGGHVRHLAPLGFLITLFLASWMNMNILVGLILLYLIIVMGAYIVISKLRSIIPILSCATLTFILHMSYGIGSFIGILSLPNKLFYVFRKSV